MTGERAFGSGVFKTVRTSKMRFEDALGWNGYRTRVWIERDELFYLQVLNDYIAGLERPLADRVPAARAVARRVETMPRYYILCRLLLPALGTAVEKDVQGIATLNVARTALAVQRHRLAHGKLPERLGDLVPAYLDAVPVDSFDVQPLRFKPLAAGFVVYSVGRDGVDNGGRAKGANDRQFQPGTDITFSVVR
jgi:hypothetical protein